MLLDQLNLVYWRKVFFYRIDRNPTDIDEISSQLVQSLQIPFLEGETHHLAINQCYLGLVYFYFIRLTPSSMDRGLTRWLI